ncbi:hypothetical protein AB3N61_15975 [Leptospira sp. WS58.C1]|uniref:hypothetical protein n=1 Tax=Leptospira cinconiae TaxID=3235173 RepID=UPI00349EC756
MPSEQVYSLLFQSRDGASSLYILFGGIVDPVSSRIDRFEVVAVGNSELINVPLSGTTFKDVTNICQKIKYEGKQLKNLTNKLQELFQNSGRSDDFMEQLIHYINKREDEKIRYLINQIQNQAMGNSKPDISLWYSLIDRDKIEEAGSGKTSFETLDSAEEVHEESAPEELPTIPIGVPTGIDASIPPTASRVQFKFILSPVSGIPVNQLKPGDQIVVQLIGNDPTTLGIIDSMKLKTEDGSIKPIPATVVATENKGVENETIVKIGNDVFGKIYEEENSIKVRLYTGEKPVSKSGGPSSASSTSNASLEAGESSLLLTVLIALGVVGIGMIAIFVFLL